MIWGKIEKEKSKELFEQYCDDESYECPKEYQKLRTEIWDIFNESLKEANIGLRMISKDNNPYIIDYVFGIKLYCLLTFKYNMSIGDASNPAVWRFLTLCVVPDIVSYRYSNEHPDRYWKKDNRLWLRSIWWYIHLSWQGNETETEDVLEKNNTDDLFQLVDRVGAGYRVDLCREIMRQYEEVPASIKRKNKVFRKIMVLNTARIQVIEPSLMKGGVEEYVKNLFDYVLGI